MTHRRASLHLRGANASSSRRRHRHDIAVLRPSPSCAACIAHRSSSRVFTGTSYSAAQPQSGTMTVFSPVLRRV
ncbi:hypothetical protein BURMUCGD1_4588 [Burkholderia multivorans CGD1]|nr:hypothetical protein BURMUCGD1_4588 [Burkholderia multivorans CGD1]